MGTNLFASVMRTVVPLIAGWLISLALWAGLDLDSEATTAAVTVMVTALYYLAFRLLEVLGTKARGTLLQRLAGIALGWARPPAYPQLPAPALQPVDPAPYSGRPGG
jgi:hypothetical protein